LGRIAILLCALGILAPAARLAAQEPASEAGPLREMVGMMADWFWHGGETELFEGRLPSDLPEWRAFLLALPDGQGHELLFRVDGLPESEIADEPRGD
jgi:hypothetical protein